MTNLLTENFEGGTSGANVTTSTSSFNNLVSNFTFSNTVASQGTLSGKVNLTTSGTALANGLSQFTAGTLLYTRFYLYVTTYPAATTTIWQFRSATTIAAEFRLGTAGNLQFRNTNTTSVGTAANGTIPLNTWVRCEYGLNTTAGTSQAKVFSTNSNGTTADFDSGSLTTVTTSTVDGYQIGIVNATTATLYYDAIAVDNASFPGPFGGTTYNKTQFLPFF